MRYSKGFAIIWLIAIIFLAGAGAGAGGYFGYKYYKKKKTEKIQKEVKKSEEEAEKAKEKEKDKTKNWQTYQNEKFGFSFKYPQGWKTQGGDIEDPTLPRGFSLNLFQAPSKCPLECLIIEINIPGPKSVFVHLFENFQNISKEEIGIDGLKATKRTSQTNQKGKELYKDEYKLIDIQFTKDSDLFQTFFSYKTNQEKQQLEIFDLILSTFKFSAPETTKIKIYIFDLGATLKRTAKEGEIACQCQNACGARETNELKLQDIQKCCFCVEDILVPVTKAVPKTVAVLRASLEELFNYTFESDSSLSNPAQRFHFKINRLAITNKVAEIDLKSEPEGVLDFDEHRAIAQILATTFQFPTVDSAKITMDGDPVFKWIEKSYKGI
jgi:hypothetical protein